MVFAEFSERLRFGFYTEETPNWERELQEELQLYECQDHDNVDENWDREIEEMLKEES